MTTIEEPTRDGVSEEDHQRNCRANNTEIIKLLRDDPTQARDLFTSPDELANYMDPEVADNQRVFDTLKDCKSVSISPTELKAALRRKKAGLDQQTKEEAKKARDEAKAAEKEAARQARVERVTAEIGDGLPYDEREYVGSFMAARGISMSWDRRYAQGGKPISVARIANDAHLTASSLGLVKPRGDLLSTTAIDRALSEWSDERREAREAELWRTIAVPTDGRVREAVLAEFNRIGEFYFTEAAFGCACIKKFIWQVKRRFRRLGIVAVHLVVLLGPQNSGKTFLIGMLLGPIEEVSAECSLQDLLDTRQMDLPSYLAANLDEMVFAERTEATALKNFMSGASPARRPMRTNLSEKVPMRATLIGTSNKRLGDLIFDASGMRRFVEAMVKQREQIEPNWEQITGFDWLGIWQCVDENGPDPMDEFKDALAQKQEEMRRPDNVELWAVDYDFSAASVTDVQKAKHFDASTVTFFGQDLFEIFHAWEKKFDPAYRGTSMTRFGTTLKSLIDFARLPAWSHRKYGSRTIYIMERGMADVPGETQAASYAPFSMPEFEPAE